MKNTFLVVAGLCFISISIASASSVKDFVETILPHFENSKKSLTMTVKSPEIDAWLEETEFFKQYAPIEFKITLRQQGESQLELSSGKRFPLEVEKKLTQLILGIEEIIFLRDKILKDLESSPSTLELNGEKLIIRDISSMVEIDFDDDLRSRGKKFAKKLTIKMNKNKNEEEVTELQITQGLFVGTMLPEVIEVRNYSRKPIYATKGHYYTTEGKVSYRLSDFEFK